jgi:ABC-type uncharacterized transport system substrate-binding protein
LAAIREHGAMVIQRILVAGLSMILSAGTALAHPHVFVDMVTEIVVSPDGKISGIAVKWGFDDAYAAIALEGMDQNGDGTYSSDELAQLTQENLESISEYGYFTVMRLAGQKLDLAGPQASSQTYIDGKLRLSFELLLKQPVDPKTGEFQVKIYDPDFYIGFNYGDTAPISATGLPSGCKLDLKPLPTSEELDTKRTFLASKPADWKPEPGEESDFGALFAQALVVSCS